MRRQTLSVLSLSPLLVGGESSLRAASVVFLSAAGLIVRPAREGPPR